MPDITVPLGKRLRISVGGLPINAGTPMIIDNDVTISLSSTFSPLLGGGGQLQKIATLITLIAREKFDLPELSLRHKAMGYHMWENTDPIMIPGLVISFYVDPTNVHGKTQVYDPILELMKLPLPGESKDFPGVLLPPGASPASILGWKEGIVRTTISIEIGNILRIDNALIKKAEPTFSNDCDSLGFPIWGKISLDIQSLETATKKNIANKLFLMRV